MTGVLPQPGVVSFARGVPAPDLLPVDELADCAAAAIRRDGRVALNYGPPGGYGPLREWLGQRYRVPAHRILVTPGSMLALNLLIAELVGRGDTAVVESPTYDRALHALRSAGAQVVAVARGAGGIDLDALEAAARRSPPPRLLYVLPTFHNPTGTTLTHPERIALAELAVEHELLVVEDDPYGLLRFEGEAPPTLFDVLRDRGADHLAVRLSSFSKSVAPGLRVGYLVLPKSLAAPLERRALDAYVSPPLLAQAQLLEFVLVGRLEPHLDELRLQLRLRRDALDEALAAELPVTARWTRPEGGYFLWLDFPPPIDAAALLGPARARGVAFVPGAGFHPDAAGASSARMAFSHPSPDQIREGCRRLGALVRERT